MTVIYAGCWQNWAARSGWQTETGEARLFGPLGDCDWIDWIWPESDEEQEDAIVF